MEWLISFVSDYAHQAHWFFFGALLLAGFNLPISEDLVVVAGGVLASTVIPQHKWLIFSFIFAGAFLSDWLAYGIGRFLGNTRWVSRWLTPKKYGRFQRYYERYGMRTLLFGRFIPFGVRNCLFMSAGMAKMTFWRFILADGIACIIGNALTFWVAYAFGHNYRTLLTYLHRIDVVLIATFLVAVIGFVCYKLRRRATNVS